MQIEGEFPEILGIRESLIKHVFEPAAQQVGLRPFLLPALGVHSMDTQPHVPYLL